VCDLDFLERLGKDLSMPINPNTAVVDFKVSKYLCEFIKKCIIRESLITVL